MRLVLTLVAVTWVAPWLCAQSELRTREQRLRYGEDAKYFTKEIRPLVEGIGTSKALVVYEGLPHQHWEPETLKKELKEKKTVAHHGFPFYKATVMVKEQDTKAIIALCRDLTTFRRYEGEKSCGGFHPDWCLEFKDADAAYQILICFGCNEARIYGPTSDVFSDLSQEAKKKLHSILGPLQQNRPKRIEE